MKKLPLLLLMAVLLFAVAWWAPLAVAGASWVFKLPDAPSGRVVDGDDGDPRTVDMDTPWARLRLTLAFIRVYFFYVIPALAVFLFAATGVVQWQKAPIQRASKRLHAIAAEAETASAKLRAFIDSGQNHQE